MKMNNHQAQDILILQLFMKTRCIFLEGTTAITRMIFIGLIYLRMHGLLSRILKGNFPPLDIEPHAVLLETICFYLEDMMEQNSWMTFTSLTLRVGSGFRFYLRNRLSPVRGIATFC